MSTITTRYYQQVAVSGGGSGTAAGTTFDNTSNGFESSDVQSAVEESGHAHFFVVADSLVNVRINRQMVTTHLVLDGCISLSGGLVFI